MSDLVTLFSSKAKGAVLRTLYYQKRPLPLRHVAAVSEVPLYSVQRALGQLVDERIVIRKKQRKYRMFSLNPKHLCYSFILQIFDLEMKWQIALSSNQYHRKAKEVLEFASSAYQVFQSQNRSKRWLPLY